MVLGTEPRTPSLLLKFSATELCPQWDFDHWNRLKSWEVIPTVANGMDKDTGGKAQFRVTPGAALPEIDWKVWTSANAWLKQQVNVVTGLLCPSQMHLCLSFDYKYTLIIHILFIY